MKAFFHLHKAGGTTIVDAAVNSGMQLPEHHGNGNPWTSDGKRINWNTMPDDEALATIRGMQDKGVDFFCFEFNFPSWQVLEQVEGLQLFTVLREPLARAFSNYRMNVLQDKNKGDPVFGFRSFMNGTNLVRAPNFYTRFFTGVRPASILSQDHLDVAIRRLEKMAQVCILERGDLAGQLEPLGFTAESFGWKNANANKKKFKKRVAVEEELDLTTYPAAPDFFQQNAYDCTLYSYFLNKAMNIAQSDSSDSRDTGRAAAAS